MVLGVVGLLALLGIAAVVFKTVAAQADGCGNTGAVALRIAAAPDIVPALSDAATAWGRTNPRVGGRCVRVTVDAQAPADVAAALAVRNGGSIDTAAKPAATPEPDSLPAVWIPDSVSWLARVSVVNQNLFAEDTPAVAMSPVVAAMPDAAAGQMGIQPGGTLKLAALGQAFEAVATGSPSSLRMAVTEPRRDAAGLAGALVLRTIVVRNPATDLPKLVAVDRAVGTNRIPDTATLAKGFAGSTPLTVAPMSEQQILAYDKAGTSPSLLVVPFSPAAPTLDYPYAALSGQPRTISQAADMFRETLRSPASRSIFARYGFRAPDGTAGEAFPVGHGATADKVAAAPMTDNAEITRVVGVWAGANTPSRLLALADLTSSMSLPLDPKLGGSSRIEVLRGAAMEGLRLFTDDSQVGLWGYAANLTAGRDFLPAVGVAPLAPAQRQTLTGVLSQVSPTATNSCGLYETVLAAYKVMRDGYVPGMSNTIVVFTDGGSNKPGGLTIDQTITKLQELSDTTRPVRVVAIGIGSDANMTELNQLTKATGGGTAFQVHRADEIRDVFLRALLKIDWNQ